MEKEKLDKFPAGLLKYVSEILANYLTGSEITDLFETEGYPHLRHDGSTKWRFIYNAFKNLNNDPDGQYHVAKIIQAFCEPTRWIGKEYLHKEVMNELNQGLIRVGLQLNGEGRLVTTGERIRFSIGLEEKPEAPVQKEALTVFPIFGARNLIQENLCFVLMPFKPPFDRIYQEHIKPTVETMGFACKRADDIFSPNPIIEDIWTHILKSKVIIADVTGRNPNVFYEIGIAHTVGRSVIIITQDERDVPFDIAQYRYFLYSDNQEGWERLRKSITIALESLKK